VAAIRSSRARASQGPAALAGSVDLSLPFIAAHLAEDRLPRVAGRCPQTEYSTTTLFAATQTRLKLHYVIATRAAAILVCGARVEPRGSAFHKGRPDSDELRIPVRDPVYDIGSRNLVVDHRLQFR
jgi:hypothetical protein